ncbi:hypothetical protein P3T73_15410 [Kiritimatiellota bacterium B12222]|nr:hypothetical protein P3T73_15410 [Kiritimatiellota bacterium B12222]
MKISTMVSQLSVSASLLLFLNACAPQTPVAKAKATAIPVPQSTPRPQVQTTTALPQPTEAIVNPTPAPVTFDPRNPDWDLRYQELYQEFAEKFTPPTPGDTVTVTLLNGRSINATLLQVNENDLALDMANGVITYNLESLSPESAATFFRSAYAEKQARAQGSLEFRRWEVESKIGFIPTTPPPPTVTDQEINVALGGVPSTGNTSTPRSGPPVNEGPYDQVTQVVDYIRKNAALPNSLRIKNWGKVEPHKSGYKVRVQYSLESAGGFGLSHEDMMFFMTANGRVYRKAAVK